VNSPIKTFTLRLPIELWEKVKYAAEQRGYTLNQFILQILWAYVENKKPPRR